MKQDMLSAPVNRTIISRTTGDEIDWHDATNLDTFIMGDATVSPSAVIESFRCHVDDGVPEYCPNTGCQYIHYPSFRHAATFCQDVDKDMLDHADEDVEFEALVEDFGLSFTDKTIANTHIYNGSLVFKRSIDFWAFDRAAERGENGFQRYSMPTVQVYSIQDVVSADVVAQYVHLGNQVGMKSTVDYDGTGVNISIIDGVPLISNGNHRYCANVVLGFGYFDGMVLEFDAEGRERLVSPDEFARRFGVAVGLGAVTMASEITSAMAL